MGGPAFRRLFKHSKKAIVWALAALMLFGQAAVFAPQAKAADSALPTLEITGTGLNHDIIIGPDDWKNYTEVEGYYSANNSQGYHKIVKVKGYKLFDLINENNLVSTDQYITFSASGFSKKKTIQELKSLNYYSDLTSNNGQKVDPIVAFYQKELYSATQSALNVDPIYWDDAAVTESDRIAGNPQIVFGQKDIDDTNKSSWVSQMTKIVVGNERSVALSIGGSGAEKQVSYTLNDLKTLAAAGNGIDESYTYMENSIEKTAGIKGVSLSSLLNAVGIKDQAASVKLVASDGSVVSQPLADVSNSTLKYVVAYEINGQPAADGSYLSVFRKQNQAGETGTVFSSIKAINLETDFTTSPYKHIAYAGAPYNVDSITSATLTIEGPGVENYKALSLRQMETDNGGTFRGTYAEQVGSDTKQNAYEGVPVSYLLDNYVKLTPNAGTVILKDKLRNTIKEYSLDDIRKTSCNAVTGKTGLKLMVAYGVNEVPLVYSSTDLGYDAAKQNDNGCLRLVTGQNAQGDAASEFSNVAYIYVTEKGAAGEYKHKNAPYNDPKYTNSMLTISGDGVGKEVNYSVSDLEADNAAMNAMRYKEEYGLSNSGYYWYYNTYEGLKLWDLLVASGLNTSLPDSTPVNFKTTDNYNVPAMTLGDIRDTAKYGYYKKDANDRGDGKFDGSAVQPLDMGKTYPVLVSYGFNGYPYVMRPADAGYNSGLLNDGGPLRIIFGKKSYSDTNGSNQIQFIKKIIVGNDTNYVTHSYGDYTSYADSGIDLKVVDENNAELKAQRLSVADIENMVYGGTDVQQQAARQKAQYFEKVYNGGKISDLFEGINLWHLLNDKIGLPGADGTVTINYVSNGAPASVVRTFAELRAAGQNEVTGSTDLKPVLAYAKNGYPLVGSKLDKGYVSSAVNSGGPLAVVFGQSADQVNTTPNATPGTYCQGITGITVKIMADKWAHVKDPYSSVAGNLLAIAGTGVSKARDVSISELESAQNYIIAPKNYCVASASGKETALYKGIDINKFLRTEIGLQSNAVDVKFTNSAGKSVTLTLDELKRSNYINELGDSDLQVMLAYGKNEKPLVASMSAVGYDVAAKNSGGPLMLLVGQDKAGDLNAAKCLEDVVKIEVEGQAGVGWKHNYGDYAEYQDQPVLRVTGSEVATPKTFTLRQLEAMTASISRDEYTGDGSHQLEGPVLWKLIKDEVGLKNPDSVSSIRVYSGAGFNKPMDLTQVKNGIKNSQGLTKQIIVAYGQDGLPLVPTSASKGYAGTNAFGPVRLIVEENKSMWIKSTDCIVVGTGEYEKPELTNILNVSGSKFGKPGKIARETMATMKSTTEDYIYLSKDAGNKKITETVNGVLLADLLKEKGISGTDYTVELQASDGFESSAKGVSYLAITPADIASQKYMLAFKKSDGTYVDDADKTGNHAYLRVYRNYNDGSDWKNQCKSIVGIRIIKKSDWNVYRNDGTVGMPTAAVRFAIPDANNGLWVATNGGGAAYRDATGKWTTYNVANGALKHDTVYDIAVDQTGGVWMTQGSPDNPHGVAYKQGNIWTYFDSKNSGLPADYVQAIETDQSGGVWFGTAKGAAYRDAAGKWTVYDKSKGMPADSVNVITIDSSGKVWFGFYPDALSTTQYNGGFACLKDGKITVYGDDDKTFGYQWARSISADNNGGIWVVRSGKTAEGGKIDYMSPTGGRTTYAANQLVPQLAAGEDLRIVTADNHGGIWVGGTASGLFFVKKPGTVDAAYSSVNEWPIAAMDSIWSIWAGNDGNVVVGSNGGIVSKTFATVPGGNTDPGNTKPADAILTLDGTGVNGTKYYSLNDLKSAGCGYGGTYYGLNSYAYDNKTAGKEYSFSGIKLKEFLNNIVGISGTAKSVKFVGSGGYTVELNMSDIDKRVYDERNSGTKEPVILAWNGDKCDGVNPLRLIVGQLQKGSGKNEQDERVNTPYWVNGIESITIQATAATSSPGGSYVAPPKTEVGALGIIDASQGSSVLTVTDKKGDKFDVTRPDKEKFKNAVDSAKPTDTKLSLTLMSKALDSLGQVGELDHAQIMQAKGKNLDIEVRSEKTGAVYTLPLQSIDLDATAKELGVKPEDLKIDIKISGITDAQEKQMQGALPDNMNMLTSPIEFTVEISAGDKTKDISDFGTRYVSREISLPATVNPDRAAGVVWNDAAKEFRPVPTVFVQDGVNGWKAVIKKRTNSIYTVIEKQAAFNDIENNPSKAEIELLTSKLIINGKTADTFDPSSQVKRSEFVVMVVKALGLDPVQLANDKFKDVKGDDWSAGYVGAAVKEGIVSGYNDGNFRPDAFITREQMTAMLAWAMKTAEKEKVLTSDEVTSELAKVKDADKIAPWAKDCMAVALNSGIAVSGQDGNVVPVHKMSRDETAAMLSRFMVSVDFIGKR